MENSSGEESDVSDSEMPEYKEKIHARLLVGKMKVKYGEEAFRCPFCPGKKKQDYKLKDLLQHASGVGTTAKRKAKERAAHLALAMYLKSILEGSVKSLQHIWKLEQKKDQKAMELYRVMEEKDRLVQEHNHSKLLQSFILQHTAY
jgi:hypothetical protein